MEDIKDLIVMKERLADALDGTLVDGYVLIGSYTVQPTKNNSTYILGTMDCVGSFQFKVWTGSLYESLIKENLTGKVCRISGKVNEFNGMKSVILDTCVPYDGDELCADDFLISKYDADFQFKLLVELLKKHCTDDGLEIFNTIIDPIKERFCKEYAAVSHHDACRSGLVAHTFKTARIVQIFKFYECINAVVDTDLLLISAALHDIGKIMEYNMGTVTDIGKQMSHLTLGVSIVSQYKDFIVNKKSEGFYNCLVSVIQQHHGEYGERPRTLIAYLIHLADGLEAHLTDIDNAIGEAVTNQVKIDSYKLSFDEVGVD